jgi:transposase
MVPTPEVLVFILWRMPDSYEYVLRLGAINMYEALEQYGINISLANPLKTRAIAEARIKYDKLDASILADLAGADLISKCYVPDRNIREIRTLIRHRIDLARRRTQLKNKVHTTLDKYMLKYNGDLFTHMMY